MSKINAVRLINLNYNNNAIKVNDEIFQMGGQSTLMSLRNGGGKSVLVQMITAPFVHKRYMRTRERSFESYFTTSKPTFIMVEWKLEQQGGYCLTGMMVRKSQMQEDLSEEPLEMINFICEYPARCEQDIYHIPVVERDKKEIRLKGFGACRQLFEEYKKDKALKFYYYDMNNAPQAKQYYDKLAEYQIYYKEWENIIRKVNFEESGLSKLFEDCKNEKGLVEKWFLDSVEQKLDRDKSRMKEFQTIIGKYISSYKDNKSKIERRDTILQFHKDMEQVEENAQQYRQSEDDVRTQENRIAAFIHVLDSLENAAAQECSALEENITKCEEELAHILYEKLSMELYRLYDERDDYLAQRDMLALEKNTLEQEIAGIEELLHKYACAKQQLTVQEMENNVSYYRERIEASKKSEEELEPLRKQLGGELKAYYQKESDVVQRQLKDAKAEYDKLRAEETKQKNKISQIEETMTRLLTQITECETTIRLFDLEEDSYNSDFEEHFARNIMGEYEPGLLDITRKQYEKEAALLTREHTQHQRQQIETQEEMHSLQRGLEDQIKEHAQCKQNTFMLEEKKAEQEKQKQERITIMRYLDASQELLWNREELLELAQHKIQEAELTKRELEKEENVLQQEWKKLTTGVLLELPDEFKELLDRLGLHPVYGMTWLDKNGYSVQENQRLVRKQPFLPYSLILSAQDMKKLKEHDKDIYTSFPIPLILREELEKPLTEDESGLLQLTGVSFYLWFNEKLLDEESLRVLIVKKEAEIKKKQEQIAVRTSEYQDYIERKNMLLRQTITQEELQNTQQALIDNQEKEKEIDAQIASMKERQNDLNRKQQVLMQQLVQEEKKLLFLQNRDKAFDEFTKRYENYLQEKMQKQSYQQQREQSKEQKKLAQTCYEKIVEDEKTLESGIRELEKQTDQIKNLSLKYEDYLPIEGLTQEAAADAESRFDAITSKLSAQLRDLEYAKDKAVKQCNTAKDTLKKLESKYHLERPQWEGITYNEEEESHQEELLTDKRKRFQGKEGLWNEKDKKVGVLTGRIEDKQKGLLEQCGSEQPLQREQIITQDFDAQKNKLLHRKKELKQELSAAAQKKQSYGENLSALAEYRDFVQKENVDWEEDIASMDVKHLREYAGVLRRDLRNRQQDCIKRRQHCEAVIQGLIRKPIYEEDYYQKPLDAMLKVTDEANQLLVQIHTVIASYESQLAKLEVDISVIGKEKDRIAGILEDYLKDVNENLTMIDNNSTITVRERALKMLRLHVPSWEENVELYRQRIIDFLNELTKGGLEFYEKNENPADYFAKNITTRNLYDHVVGTGNVQIKLYKIEEQREYPISWADVAKNSGGEGFLSAFVILSSLLYYMRRDDTDIFSDKNEGKVLVMDNPFAQTSSAHLLKPLMEMAKKNNTQLICLSGLGGDSIYSRFDNIYVLNLVASGLRGDVSYLRSEHTRGAEEETMISSRIEVYEQQSLLF